MQFSQPFQRRQNVAVVSRLIRSAGGSRAGIPRFAINPMPDVLAEVAGLALGHHLLDLSLVPRRKYGDLCTHDLQFVLRGRNLLTLWLIGWTATFGIDVGWASKASRLTGGLGLGQWVLANS